jgi:hypothetical protein
VAFDAAVLAAISPTKRSTLATAFFASIYTAN